MVLISVKLWLGDRTVVHPVRSLSQNNITDHPKLGKNMALAKAQAKAKKPVKTVCDRPAPGEIWRQYRGVEVEISSVITVPHNIANGTTIYNGTNTALALSAIAEGKEAVVYCHSNCLWVRSLSNFLMRDADGMPQFVKVRDCDGIDF
ncbi:MAG: hypothetical protein ACRC62_15550 [Microcoleus sp.]